MTSIVFPSQLDTVFSDHMVDGTLESKYRNTVNHNTF